MKLTLTALLLDVAAAQMAPIRLRSSDSHRLLKRKPHQAQQHDLAVAAPSSSPIDHHGQDSLDGESWDIQEEFGRFVLLEDLSISLSLSYSYSFSAPSSSEPTTILATDEPSPQVHLTDAPSPSPVDVPSLPPALTVTPTLVPSPAPSLTGTTSSSPTLSKAGKQPKLPTKELLTYSWSLPIEYTGYFHLYQTLNKKEEPTLLQTVQLGTGTANTSNLYLESDYKYTIRIINQNQTVGYCCAGSSPGYIQFTYGGIVYDPNTLEYYVGKGKEEFVAEFHKNFEKIDVEEGVGAFYEFDFKL